MNILVNLFFITSLSLNDNANGLLILLLLEVYLSNFTRLFVQVNKAYFAISTMKLAKAFMLIY